MLAESWEGLLALCFGFACKTVSFAPFFVAYFFAKGHVTYLLSLPYAVKTSNNLALSIERLRERGCRAVVCIRSPSINTEHFYRSVGRAPGFLRLPKDCP